MTIRLELYDGNTVKTYTYRKVYKGASYAQMVESFYAMRDGYKWGEMYQLKGKEIILKHSFGGD